MAETYHLPFMEALFLGGGRRRSSSPGEEERLRQVVVDIDDEVVIGHRVYVRPWELPIDEDSLSPDTTRRNASEPIFCMDLNVTVTKDGHTYKHVLPNLLSNPERVDIAVGDGPVEEPVRALSRHRGRSQNGPKGNKQDG